MTTKVLITGAGGFIGHHLARYLKAKGCWVRGANISKPRFSSLEDFDEFLQLDLRDPANCLRATKGMEQVYALAAKNGSIEFTTTVRARIMHDNVLINVNTAEACHVNGVKRLFFSSSACVYPLSKQTAPDSPALKESDVTPADPDSDYGWEKLFSEHLYQAYAADHGLEVRIARFFNVYGTECLVDTVRSKAPLALTRKVIQAGEDGEVKIWGDGKQTRSFIHIKDCVAGIYALMQSEVEEPVNLGTTDLFSINQLVDLIAEIEGVKVNKIHQLDKVQGVRGRLCDTTKARRLLSWQPTVSMQDGLIEVNKYVHQQLARSR